MDDRKQRRMAMLDKVRKLMAMARHAAGNEQEQETALRQANKLMAQFGIAEAEVDMELLQRGQMEFGEQDIGGDGYPTGLGARDVPQYASMLAVGVGRFTDTYAKLRRKPKYQYIVFQGAVDDVEFAIWVFGILTDAIQVAQQRSGYKRKQAEEFRSAASVALNSKLMKLVDERRNEQQGTGNALVVVDWKQREMAERFGEPNYGRVAVARGGAAQAGAYAGSQINIPAGKPIKAAQHRRLK